MCEKKVRLLAFHLPQFHTIPENDEWWGEGFTEWTNTKKAVPLFQGHHQPRTPKDEFYYDLSKKEDLAWEMKLASEYNLDGFCYYHYWFNGRLLLEKPLELMLQISERVPYCFCWANEPWIRSWEGSNKVLMEQTYPGEDDWKAHFDYLKQFFQDEKYITVDNKPVFVLYRTKSINRCEEMIAYWDACCKELGYDGIYIIEEKNGFQNETTCSNSSAYLEFEPLYTNKFGRSTMQKMYDYISKKVFNLICKTDCLLYSYDHIWKAMLRREHEVIAGKKACLGAFVDWDNTARKGKKSTFFVGAAPVKFGYYLKKQVEVAKEIDSPFIFINAWNEWGEGTYLEPDDTHGYAYLEQLKKVSEEIS